MKKINYKKVDQEKSNVKVILNLKRNTELILI